MYGKCGAWYMRNICWRWYEANVACRYGISPLVFNSRSYLFALWYIELNSISVYAHVLFYMYLLTFFLIVFLTLGSIPIGPASIVLYFTYSYYTQSGIFLDCFDSTVFSMVNSFLLTTDGLHSREDGNRWRFPSPWLGSPGWHTCTEIICSKYRQGKRRAKIQTSETNLSTWCNFQKVQCSF